MSYHKDKEVNSALIRLLDALCEWERNTGRRSYLFLIPEEQDDKILIAQDGKPLDNVDPETMFKLARQNRGASFIKKYRYLNLSEAWKK